MGWGWKKLAKTLFYSAAGGPGLGEMMGVSPNLDSGMTEVGKGVGNLFTGGYIANRDATEQAKKARNQAKGQYEAAEASAKTEAERIANLEEERKRRLLLYGTQNPATLMGSYTGLPGQANVGRATLG